MSSEARNAFTVLEEKITIRSTWIECVDYEQLREQRKAEEDIDVV
jgi:hypothetical protein